MNNGNITINDVEVENPMYKGGVKTANWMNMLRNKLLLKTMYMANPCSWDSSILMM
jgi:hypothetical protein